MNKKGDVRYFIFELEVRPNYGISCEYDLVIEEH
jgi:hypothetical protein